MALFLIPLLGGCVSLQPPVRVEFRDLAGNPSNFEGKRLEVRCWLADDGFETQLVSDPTHQSGSLAFAYSSRLEKVSAGPVIVAFRDVIRRKKKAEVLIVGRIRAFDHRVLWPKGKFTIEQILEAGEIRTPNQAAHPTTL